MPKTYLPISVLEAAQTRLRTIFDHFETICVSYSGGKDSTVLLELARQEAARRGRKLHVLVIDLEAQYRVTIEQIERSILHDDTLIVHWICLPLNLRNALSVFQPHWCCWDTDEQRHWVRPLPEYDCVIHDPSIFPWFRPRMEFEDFIVEYPKWLIAQTGSASLASLVAIRADESLNRYKAVAKKEGGKKSAWRLDGEEIRWGTTLDEKHPHIVSFYPIYDWGFEDIWRYIADTDIAYNRIYDLMYLAGIPNSEMRICQPYGDDQRKGLDLWAQVEPETWTKVLDRVVGVNYGAKYARQKMMGYRRGLGCPAGHTWKSYTFFLLATLPDVMRERYLSNFAVFLEWWQRHGYANLDSIHQDETIPLQSSEWHKLPSWRRLALAILKNDFNCKSLTIGMIKDVHADVYDRVTNGEPVKVRKSVQPVYAALRDQYQAYLAGGVDAVTLALPRPPHPLKEKYKDL